MPEPSTADIPSVVPGIVWPAIPSPADARMLGVAAQFAHAERLASDALRDRQRTQLAMLLQHAQATVPFYRDRLEAVTGRRGHVDWHRWDEVPPVTRSDVQRAGRGIMSERIPRTHGAVREVSTSGSTGTPLRALETSLQQCFYGAAHLRFYRWHDVRLEATVAATRSLGPAPPADWGEQRADNWRPGFRTGPAHLIDVRAPVERQLEWLERTRPRYLLTFPSNLLALLDALAAGSKQLETLEQVHTYGETVGPALRERCLAVLGAPVADAYSAIELGVMAMQAPGGTHYHTMAETHLVEIVKDDGSAAGPGEVGRVVVTALHGFATPFIRYALGDYAEAGAPRGDGITLPVIERIIGRTRNMAVRPNGERYWPAFHGRELCDLAPVSQVQLVQHSPDRIELRFVASREPEARECDAMAQHLATTLGAGYAFEFTRLADIERGPGGKYEDFVCHVGT